MDRITTCESAKHRRNVALVRAPQPCVPAQEANGVTEGDSIEIGVDIGGTFTDIVCRGGGAPLRTLKIPTSRGDPSRAVLDALAHLSDTFGIKPASIARFLLGTTIATNAVLERKGARTGLIASHGFRDVLEIGFQLRKDLYRVILEPVSPVFLAPGALRREAIEQVSAQGDIIVPLDETSVCRAVDELAAEGVQAIAVCYLFSFLHPAHEQRTRELIEARHPDIAVSLSCEVDPAFREYERTVVTAFDAYMKPVVARLPRTAGGWIGFGACAGAIAGDAVARRAGRHRGGAAAAGAAVFVGSGGGRHRRGDRRPRSRAARPDYHRCRRHQQRYRADRGRRAGDSRGRRHRRLHGAHSDGGCECDRRRRRQHRVAGWGGGLRVGPHSAGADPGPACYGRGGEQPTVTDASVVLGWLDPAYFAGGAVRLDPARAREAVSREIAGPLGMTAEAAALGIHRVVNAQMTEGIRLVSIRRGLDPRRSRWWRWAAPARCTPPPWPPSLASAAC